MRDYRATLNAVGWSLAACSTLFIAARTFTRLKINTTKLGTDDWCMLVGWVFAIACTALVTVGTSFGFGLHINDIQAPEDQAKAAMYVLITPTVSIASAFFTKASIIIGLMRIMGQTATWVHKTIAYAPLVILLILSILSSAFMIFFCSPVQKSWRPYLPGTCLSTSILNSVGKSVSAYNAFMDVCCAVAPIFLIHRLNIARKDKRSLILLMSGSIFGTFATIMKIVAMSNITNVADITHAWSEITIWYLAENHILIIAGSCPALRPLWRTAVNKYSSYLSSSDRSKHSRSHSRPKSGADQLVSLQTIGHRNKNKKMPNLYSTTVKDDSQEELYITQNKECDNQSLDQVLVNHGDSSIEYKSQVTGGQSEKQVPSQNGIQITTTREVKVI